MKPKDKETAEGFLFTDEYQLTMAQLYFRLGLHEKHVQFDHFFRDYPDYGLHQAGYCINAGLEWLLDWIQDTHCRESDIEYLRSQNDKSGNPIFANDFLSWLRKNGNFSGISIYSIPEGRVVHPNIPLTVVQGPLAMAQILETPLLNHLNYQTLIATKASRIHESGRGQVMLEFGLRRGPEKGANAGSRAALIGGADYSSNVGLSHVLGYPPKGTHAHSMVQLFIALGKTELDAFQAFAEVYPDNCILLVDTINTLESGLPNAIKVFTELRKKGHEPIGIRLDSGDLAYLSIQSVLLLDEAGFPNTSIVLSNNLDELTIWQILTQIQEESPRYKLDPDHVIRRLVYGVGTRLIMSWGDPALDGVYKLVAVNELGKWIPAIKISESPEKMSNPGYKLAWRLYDSRGLATADVLSLEDENPNLMNQIELHHPTEQTKYRRLTRTEITAIEPLFVEVLKGGEVVYEIPDIETIRQQRRCDVERLDPGVRRLVNPHIYHVSLTRQLWNLKQDLIKATRESNG